MGKKFACVEWQLLFHSNWMENSGEKEILEFHTFENMKTVLKCIIKYYAQTLVKNGRISVGNWKIWIAIGYFRMNWNHIGTVTSRIKMMHSISTKIINRSKITTLQYSG